MKKVDELEKIGEMEQFEFDIVANLIKNKHPYQLLNDGRARFYVPSTRSTEITIVTIKWEISGGAPE